MDARAGDLLGSLARGRVVVTGPVAHPWVREVAAAASGRAAGDGAAQLTVVGPRAGLFCWSQWAGGRVPLAQVGVEHLRRDRGLLFGASHLLVDARGWQVGNEVRDLVVGACRRARYAVVVADVEDPAVPTGVGAALMTLAGWEALAVCPPTVAALAA